MPAPLATDLRALARSLARLSRTEPRTQHLRASDYGRAVRSALAARCGSRSRSATGFICCWPFRPAGFLVRLFMIQHDCGHGAFFRHRLANDWVGRVIGVLTLTPYDFWRRTPCDPSRDLGQSRSARHRRHRHADGARISGAVALGPAALSALPPSARHVRPRPGLSVLAAAPPAGRLDARRLAALGQHHGDQRSRSRWSSAVLIWLVGVGPFLLVHLPITLLARVDRRLAVLRAAPVRGHVLGARRDLERARGGAARQLALRSAARAALVHRQYRRAPRPPSVQPHSVLPAAAGAARSSRAARKSAG